MSHPANDQVQESILEEINEVYGTYMPQERQEAMAKWIWEHLGDEGHIYGLMKDYVSLPSCPECHGVNLNESRQDIEGDDSVSEFTCQDCKARCV